MRDAGIQTKETANLKLLGHQSSSGLCRQLVCCWPMDCCLGQLRKISSIPFQIYKARFWWVFFFPNKVAFYKIVSPPMRMFPCQKATKAAVSRAVIVFRHKDPFLLAELKVDHAFPLRLSKNTGIFYFYLWDLSNFSSSCPSSWMKLTLGSKNSSYGLVSTKNSRADTNSITGPLGCYHSKSQESLETVVSRQISSHIAVS